MDSKDLNWLVKVIKNIMKKEHPDQVKWSQALEVPCGSGRAAFILQDVIQETFGIDASRENIDKAIIKYGNRDPSRVTFLQADFKQVLKMFQESSFDLIILYDHICDDWLNALSVIKHILKSTGLLLFYSCVSAKSADPEVNQLFKLLPEDHSLFPFNEILSSKVPSLDISCENDVSVEMTLNELKEWYKNEKVYKQVFDSENHPLVEEIEKQFEKLETLNVEGHKYKVQQNYLFSRVFGDELIN